jgi:uncharacterized tellurite resistance protein B-like protein
MSIFDRVRGLLGSRAPLANDKRGEAADLDLQVATVVLLLETAYGDEEYVPRERDTIRRGIEREFGISKEDAVRLLESGELSRRERRDVSSVSAQIEARYDVDQRKRIIDLLWRVIYADRIVDEGEEALAEDVTRLAGLTREQGLEARRKAFVWFSKHRPGRL